MRFARLPVDDVEIQLRDITGVDELLLLESGVANNNPEPAILTDQPLLLAARLATAPDGSPINWRTAPVTNVDALMLLIRKFSVGDVLCAQAVCPGSSCNTRIDITFSITEYLSHHEPRMPRGVVRLEGSNRFELSDCGQFRIPTIADQLAIQGSTQPRKALVSRCIRPADLPAAHVRRLERAMDAIAPLLVGQVEGACPGCAASVSLYFDPRAFVLTELCDRAHYIYEDVCLLANVYHWSEAEIVAMPAARRAKYAEIAREQRSDN